MEARARLVAGMLVSHAWLSLGQGAAACRDLERDQARVCAPSVSAADLFRNDGRRRRRLRDGNGERPVVPDVDDHARSCGGAHGAGEDAVRRCRACRAPCALAHARSHLATRRRRTGRRRSDRSSGSPRTWSSTGADDRAERRAAPPRARPLFSCSPSRGCVRTRLFFSAEMHDGREPRTHTRPRVTAHGTHRAACTVHEYSVPSGQRARAARHITPLGFAPPSTSVACRCTCFAPPAPEKCRRAAERGDSASRTSARLTSRCPRRRSRAPTSRPGRRGPRP